MKFNNNNNLNIIPSKVIGLFQEGGEMVAGDPMLEGEQPQGGDPMEQMVQMAMQAVEGQDCEAAMMVSQMFLEMVAQMGQQEEAPVEEAPVV